MAAAPTVNVVDAPFIRTVRQLWRCRAPCGQRGPNHSDGVAIVSLARASVSTAAHPRGIRVNLGQFTLQTVQVFFVGLMIGMERTVLPSLSAQFGVAQGAFLFLASFVIAFGLVKGALNLVAGSLSDRIGRKPPIILGFALLALGIAVTAVSRAMPGWSFAAAIMGLGMALLYPNLIAALADFAPPLWRGRALGTYRYWRDTGYAVGALLLGVVADLTGGVTVAMWGTAALVALSGLWIALAVEESRPRQTMRGMIRTMSGT